MHEAILKPSSEAQNRFELKVAMGKIWDSFPQVQLKKQFNKELLVAKHRPMHSNQPWDDILACTTVRTRYGIIVYADDIILLLPSVTASVQTLSVLTDVWHGSNVLHIWVFILLEPGSSSESLIM